MLLNNSDNVVIDEALVLHQAQPPKIPSLLRIQASAAAHSSSFSPCFAALSGGHSLATGPLKKNQLRIRLSSAPDRLKDLKCANAKMKGKVVPQQHSPLKDPLWTFHFSARLKLLNFQFLNMPCTVADDSILVLQGISYLNVQHFRTLSETGWHQEQELIHFDRQSVGIDCTILILSPDQCSPKPKTASAQMINSAKLAENT